MNTCVASIRLMKFQVGYPRFFFFSDAHKNANLFLGGLIILHSSIGRSGLEGGRVLTSFPSQSKSFLPCGRPMIDKGLPCQSLRKTDSVSYLVSAGTQGALLVLDMKPLCTLCLSASTHQRPFQEVEKSGLPAFVKGSFS